MTGRKLLAEHPMIMEAKGAIVELSAAVKGPRVIELVRTPSEAHATCAVCMCVLRRGFFFEPDRSMHVRA